MLNQTTAPPTLARLLNAIVTAAKAQSGCTVTSISADIFVDPTGFQTLKAANPNALVDDDDESLVYREGNHELVVLIQPEAEPE